MQQPKASILVCILAAGISAMCPMILAADDPLPAAAPANPGAALPDEATLLPFETITQADIHNAFAPSYTGDTARLLPEPLRATLEQSVYHRLHFLLQVDEESCRGELNAATIFWGNKPLPADYKLRKEQMDQAKQRIDDGPIRRLGIPDHPFQVRRARFDQAFPEVTAMLPPKQKAQAQREVLVVAVQAILKITPAAPGGHLYRPYDFTLVCDPASSTPVFYSIQAIARHPLTDPAADLPLLLRSTPAAPQEP